MFTEHSENSKTTPGQAGNPDDNGAANTCSICIMSRSEEEEKQQMCQLLCHHKFHLKCITLWLMKRSTCPVCRTPVFLLPN
uniref:RING-type domain-containing protein n=1 Tax=Erpetoichthys calabaricus TaxID=27687 RepID=A0A8C4S7Z5_ERPCA